VSTGWPTWVRPPKIKKEIPYDVRKTVGGGGDRRDLPLSPRGVACRVCPVRPAVVAGVGSGSVRLRPGSRPGRPRNLGEDPLDEAFVRMHVGLREGDPYHPATVFQDVRALLDTGRFSQVTTDVEALGSELAVVFSLRNRLRLARPVEVNGAEHFRQSRIRDMLDLAVGDRVDDAVMGARAQNVLREYRKERFPDVAATWSVEALRPELGECAARIDIREGRRAHITKYVFEGNEALADGALRKAMKHPSPWAPWSWILKYRYDPNEVESGRMRILDLYRNAGYLDAEVDAVEFKASDSGALTGVVRVHEGPLYRIGNINLKGAALFPELSLRRLIPFDTGAVASEQRIRAAAEALRLHYTSRGYLETDVAIDRAPRADERILDLNFDIREGRLTRVRQVEIRGNIRTRDKVIRRELVVVPGDILDEQRVRRSERRLQNLGFFSSVRSRTEDPLIPDARDLIFEVEEKRTGQFMMGVGFSSIDNLMGYMEISQGNFDLLGWPYLTGGGQKIKLAAQAGEQTQRYELSFVEPWFLDRELSLGFDLYLNRASYSDYDIERRGGAVRLAWALPFAARADVQYGLERNRVVDVADTNLYVNIDTGAPFLFARDEDDIKSTLSFGVTRDTRDSPFFPRRGHRVRLSGHVAGGPLGFDTDLYGMEVAASHYTPLWFGHVFSARMQANVVESYGRTSVTPLSERLFAGGMRSIRGYRYRGVGPKARREAAGPDDRDHRMLGGNSRALAGVEYTIPLVTGIRAAAFYDMGNVWEESYTFDFSELASGAGIGLRLDIPGFPMQLDYAWALEPDDELSRTEKFSFGIGYGF